MAVGVHGSVARGDDTPGSDLDLAVITAGPRVQVPSRVFRYRGVIVDLDATDAATYLEAARTIRSNWPVVADQYLNQRPIHDPGFFFDRIRRVHRQALDTADDGVFRRAAARDLIGALGWQAKAEACLDRNQLLGARVAVGEAAVGAALVVGLLARHSFRNVLHACEAVATQPELAPPEVARPFRSALAASGASLAVPAMRSALDALSAHCLEAGLLIDVATLQAFVE